MVSILFDGSMIAFLAVYVVLGMVHSLQAKNYKKA